MKLHLSLLKKFVDLPLSEIGEIKDLLDDVGLEVKSFDYNADKSDVIFNIELLANRGDHHSVLGMAREIASRNLSALRTPPLTSINNIRSISLPLRVSSDLCLRYALLEISLSDGLSLLPEIKATLLGASKHPLVDTLNYVQYEMGQPLHAFDRDKVTQEVRVDTLKEECDFEALDGQVYRVPTGSVVICDGKGIIAVAGVIGSLSSAVSESTKRVVIESACFDPVAVRKTARAMGISTDASKIFERGSDPENVLLALQRLNYLLSGAGGAVREGGCQTIGYMEWPGGKSTPIREIEVALSAVREAINAPRLPELEIEMRLKTLGFLSNSVVKGSRFRVTVPSWRIWDVHDEQDIVEEFVRSYGFNRIKDKKLVIEPEFIDEDQESKVISRLVPILRSGGFSEVITKSFYSEEIIKFWDAYGFASECYVRLKNSIESNNSGLRLSLLPLLLNVAVENMAHSVDNIKIYEFGRTYERESGKAKEAKVLSFLWLGNWHNDTREEKLSLNNRFSVGKGFIEQMLAEFGLEETVFNFHPIKFFHPGISSRMVIGRRELGILGIVHPAIMQKYDIKATGFYGELDLSTFSTAQIHRGYEEPSRFPAIRRDITVVVPRKISADKVRNQMMHFLPSGICEQIAIHDWFELSTVEVTKVTYRCTFRDSTRTLESSVIDGIINDLRTHIKDKLGFELG